MTSASSPSCRTGPQRFGCFFVVAARGALPPRLAGYHAKLDPQQFAAEVGWLDVPEVSC